MTCRFNCPPDNCIHPSSGCSEVPAGWTPPVIYDLVRDTHRAATQEDIDALTRTAERYNRLCAKLRRALEAA